MHVATLTFEGFSALDSLIAPGILNRVKKPDWRVSIACPAPRVRSMNGVVLEAQASLAEAAKGAMHYVAPVGEKDDYVERMLRNITPYLSQKV